MPYTQEQLESWKAQYGNVYNVTIRGIDYIFRELTYAEHDAAIAVERASDSASAEDEVVLTALLYPTANFDRMPAGIVSSLADEILEFSGFGAPRFARDILDEIREAGGTFRDLMKAFILATMPMHREEELDQLTFRQMAKKLVLAEQIIKVNQTAFGAGDNDMRLDLIDPEEEEEKARIEAQKHAAQKKPGTAGFNDPIAEKLQQSLG